MAEKSSDPDVGFFVKVKKDQNFNRRNILMKRTTRYRGDALDSTDSRYCVSRKLEWSTVNFTGAILDQRISAYYFYDQVSVS